MRMNHRNRTWGFLALGLVIGAHLLQTAPTWPTWGLLFVTFLLYPQLAWLVARHAKTPLQQELWHMRFDALLCGAWSAALHFPLWIVFALFTSVTLNLALFRGLRGLGEAALAWGVGVLVAGALLGWGMHPDTDPVVAWTTMIVLSTYLLVTGLDNHQRSMKLHETREQLKRKEQHLQHQLQEIHELQSQLKEQALRDSLTGLFNRHHLGETLQREIERCRRTRQPLSVVLIDVDHFKHINDTWGHQTGDEVLRQVAQRLQANTRTSDGCFRYGGEEFLLVLPETASDTAWQKADALRQSLVTTPLIQTDHPVLVTISAGLATFPEQGSDMDTLIAAADKALYRAKHEGRNRTLVAVP